MTAAQYVEHGEEHEKTKTGRALEKNKQQETKKQSTLRHVLLQSCEVVRLLANGNFMAKVPTASGSESIINVFELLPPLTLSRTLLLCCTCQ